MACYAGFQDKSLFRRKVVSHFCAQFCRSQWVLKWISQMQYNVNLTQHLDAAYCCLLSYEQQKSCAIPLSLLKLFGVLLSKPE